MQLPSPLVQEPLNCPHLKAGLTSSSFVSLNTVFVIGRTRFGVNAVDMDIARLVKIFRSSTDNSKLKCEVGCVVMTWRHGCRQLAAVQRRTELSPLSYARLT